MKVVHDNDQQPQQGPTNDPTLNINLREADWMKCEKCENTTFMEAMKIKKISKFMTGSEQDSIAPFPVLTCVSCGHVNSELEPKI